MELHWISDIQVRVVDYHGGITLDSGHLIKEVEYHSSVQLISTVSPQKALKENCEILTFWVV